MSTLTHRKWRNGSMLHISEAEESVLNLLMQCFLFSVEHIVLHFEAFRCDKSLVPSSVDRMSCTSVCCTSNTASVWHLIRSWFKYRDTSTRRQTLTHPVQLMMCSGADLSLELSHHTLDLSNFLLYICVSLQCVFYLYQCLIHGGKLPLWDPLGTW